MYRDAQMPFDADSDRDALVEETAFSTWTAVSRTTTPRVCWTYREVDPGIYESRRFDPEGRPLAHLDKGTKRKRIVPLACTELGEGRGGEVCVNRGGSGI